MKRVAILLLLPITVASSEITRVAVIDTGIDFTHPYLKTHKCTSGHKDFTGTTLDDIEGHGTHVAGLITRYAKNSPFCLVSLKYYVKESHPDTTVIRLSDAIQEAATLGIKIVNLSGGGNLFDEREYNLIKDNQDIDFIVAAGNGDKNLDIYDYFPASYLLPNVKVVGCKTTNNLKCSFSNYGKAIDYWELGDNVLSTYPNRSWKKMSGTSMSTAIRTGKYLYEHQKL